VCCAHCCVTVSTVGAVHSRPDLVLLDHPRLASTLSWPPRDLDQPQDRLHRTTTAQRVQHGPRLALGTQLGLRGQQKSGYRSGVHIGGSPTTCLPVAALARVSRPAGHEASALGGRAVNDRPQHGVEDRPLRWGDRREPVIYRRITGDSDLLHHLDPCRRGSRNTHAAVPL
jgi:hypothetical protein